MGGDDTYVIDQFDIITEEVENEGVDDLIYTDDVSQVDLRNRYFETLMTKSQEEAINQITKKR